MGHQMAKMGHQKADIRMPAGTSEVKNWISDTVLMSSRLHYITATDRLHYYTASRKIYTPCSLTMFKHGLQGIINHLIANELFALKVDEL